MNCNRSETNNLLFLSLTYNSSYLEVTLAVIGDDFSETAKEIKHFPNLSSSSSCRILDSAIQSLIDSHNVKRVYTFGDHRILHQLKSLTNLPIIDLRSSRIDEDSIICVTDPYSPSFTRTPPQPPGTKVLPDVSESISNLCFLIGRNIVNFHEEGMCISFNNPKRFSRKVCPDCQTNTTCTVILSQMNCFNTMALMWARRLINQLGGRKNRPYDIIEFILQCLFLHLAFPSYVHWEHESQQWLRIYIRGDIVMRVSLKNHFYWLHPNFHSRYVKEIRGKISNFNMIVTELEIVQHVNNARLQLTDLMSDG